MEENGSISYLGILFGSASLGELLSNIDMIGEIMAADKRIYEQYGAAREETEALRAEYEATLGELDEKQAELESERAELERQIEEAEELIAEYEEQLNADREAYEAQLAKEQALEADIQAMIAELERQEAAKNIVSTGYYNTRSSVARQRLRLAHTPNLGRQALPRRRGHRRAQRHAHPGRRQRPRHRRAQ